MTNSYLPFDEYCSIFAQYGDPGAEYLRDAYGRMCLTHNLATVNLQKGSTVLDVGAHLLHHSLLYAMCGYSVIAVDLKVMSDPESHPVIKGVSSQYKIKTINYKDLSDPVELESLAESSVSLVLFTEIIEHITFNPVKMWTAIYRLLGPQGRIVVTTPNYFALGHFTRDILKIAKGRSPGLSPKEIVGINTYGHHWRVYSARDLVDYFSELSPDWSISRVEYLDCVSGRQTFPSVGKVILKRLFRVLRDTIYLEITLPGKIQGITAVPHWHHTTSA